MVQNLYSFIVNCWSWIPVEIYAMFTIFILITFGDSLLGLLDRTWRIIGR